MDESLYCGPGKFSSARIIIEGFGAKVMVAFLCLAHGFLLTREMYFSSFFIGLYLVSNDNVCKNSRVSERLSV